MKKVIKVIEGLRAKSSRLVHAVKRVELGREGKCKPTECSTLGGRIGAACCYLDYECLYVSEQKCFVYPLRPLNCRAFPARREHLKLVRNCGYYWADKKNQEIDNSE